MLKKIQVVMLPTNEKANQGVFVRWNEKLSINNKKQDSNILTHHLYFLSDEEIKEGDWFYWGGTTPQIQKAVYGSKPTDIVKKIIATTDSSLTIDKWAQTNKKFKPYNIQQNIETTKLIKKQLPQPSQSFLEVFVTEYNKGNQIKEVLIEYQVCTCAPEEVLCYCTTPKLKINPKDNTITIKKVKDSWNREEVLAIIDQTWGYKNESIRTKEEWIALNL